MTSGINPCLKRFEGKPGYFGLSLRTPESDVMDVYKYYTADEIMKANTFITENGDKANVYYNVSMYDKQFKERPVEKRITSTLLHYVDIDSHIFIFTKTEAQNLLQALKPHFSVDIPDPSMIIYTGNGLQLLFDLYGTQDIYKFKRIQEALNNKFDDIIAGYNAILGVENSAKIDNLKDANRYLRVPGTINTREVQGVSGRYSEVIYTSGNIYTQDEIIKNFPQLEYHEGKKRHPLQDLENVTDTDKLKATRKHLKKKRYGIKGYTIKSLNKARYRDYLKLIEMRNAAGIIEGYRNNLLMLFANTIILQTSKREELERDLKQINTLFAKPLTSTELRKWYNSNINAIMQDRRYYQSNEFIIELLDISQAEQTRLETIISGKEQDRRYYQNNAESIKEKRKAEYKPVKEWTEAERRKTARECQDLAAEGYSITQIAEKTELSRPTVYKYLQLI